VVAGLLGGSKGSALLTDADAGNPSPSIVATARSAASRHSFVVGTRAKEVRGAKPNKASGPRIERTVAAGRRGEFALPPPGPARNPIGSASRAPASQEIDQEEDQQNQAECTAADGGAAKIEPAAAKQEEQNEEDNDKVHAKH